MARKLNLDTSERLDITCKRGDSFSMQITLKDSTGTGLQLLTNKYEFVMQVRTTESQSKFEKSANDAVLSTATGLSKGGDTKTIQVNDVDDSGNLTMYISPEVMKDIQAGRYVYEIQYKVDSNGTTIQKTVLKGSFTVNNDISE